MEVYGFIGFKSVVYDVEVGPERTRKGEEKIEEFSPFGGLICPLDFSNGYCLLGRAREEGGGKCCCYERNKRSGRNGE